MKNISILTSHHGRLSPHRNGLLFFAEILQRLPCFSHTFLHAQVGLFRGGMLSACVNMPQ